jgi:hypothetical protein
MKKLGDVRTVSAKTAAALMLLGHKPLDVRRNRADQSVVSFAPDGEPDRRRYFEAKRLIESLMSEAVADWVTR